MSSLPVQVAAGQLRAHMPAAEKYAYFDHAAVAPIPDVAAAAMRAYVDQVCQQGDLPWLRWSGQLAELRQSAAQFLNASPDEIALVSNTTQGIGLVAEGYPWQAGDNVVVPDNEFPSNILPWQSLQRRGVELRRVTVDSSGALDLQRIDRAIDARTRIVSLSWVGFASGYRVDVAQVAELVHSRDALLMLDAIQGLGAFRLDCQASGVDFVCADGHKWLLGPEGAGILFVRREHLQRLEPLGLGWNSLESSSFDPQSSKIKSNAARYEGGSTNMPGMIGLGASLKLLSSLHRFQAGSSDPADSKKIDVGPGGPPSEPLSKENDWSPVTEAIMRNVAVLERELQRAGFQPQLPDELRRRSGIVPISWKEAELGGEKLLLAARQECISRGVVLSVRGGRLRAAAHAYNNESDIARLVEALVAFRKQV